MPLLLQGRNEVYFFVTDPIFSPQILIPDPKIAGEFDPWSRKKFVDHTYDKLSKLFFFDVNFNI